jgi:hypothetical protein
MNRNGSRPCVVFLFKTIMAFEDRGQMWNPFCEIRFLGITRNAAVLNATLFPRSARRVSMNDTVRPTRA